jgi:hypothetical protein
LSRKTEHVHGTLPPFARHSQLARQQTFVQHGPSDGGGEPHLSGGQHSSFGGTPATPQRWPQCPGQFGNNPASITQLVKVPQGGSWAGVTPRRAAFIQPATAA